MKKNDLKIYKWISFVSTERKRWKIFVSDYYIIKYQ